MTNSEELFEITSKCINSLVESENNIEMEIIIVESNKKYLISDFLYPDIVKVIVPESIFNFHKFLNIGIKQSCGEFIALCNNDLIFHKNWFSQILKTQKMYPQIKSFSPSGKWNDNSFDKTHELGYKVRTHIMGWCIVANREIFPKIGFLDEKFDFYFADNDYAMTLKRYNIKHAVIYNSYVVHLEKKSTKINEDIRIDKREFLKKYDIPSYLRKEEYEWVLDCENNLSGFLKFHDKWGSPVLYHRKNKISDLLIRFKLGFLNWFILYNNMELK